MYITILQWGMTMNNIKDSETSNLFFLRGWNYKKFTNKVVLIDKKNEYLVFVNFKLFEEIAFALKVANSLNDYTLEKLIYSIKNKVGIK